MCIFDQLADDVGNQELAFRSKKLMIICYDSKAEAKEAWSADERTVDESGAREGCRHSPGA